MRQYDESETPSQFLQSLSLTYHFASQVEVAAKKAKVEEEAANKAEEEATVKKEKDARQKVAKEKASKERLAAEQRKATSAAKAKKLSDEKEGEALRQEAAHDRETERLRIRIRRADSQELDSPEAHGTTPISEPTFPDAPTRPAAAAHSIAIIEDDIEEEDYDFNFACKSGQAAKVAKANVTVKQPSRKTNPTVTASVMPAPTTTKSALKSGRNNRMLKNLETDLVDLLEASLGGASSCAGGGEGGRGGGRGRKRKGKDTSRAKEGALKVSRNVMRDGCGAARCWHHD